MNEERRVILDRVAAGTLDPTEAARLLDELGSPTAGASPADQGEPAEEWAVLPPPSTPLRGIRITAAAGSVRVVGDTDVAEAAVHGPHALRRAGDVLVVDCGPLQGRLPEMPLAGTWVFGSHPPPTPRWRGSWRQVTVRVNPELPLDMEVTAGQLVLRGSRAAVRCTVSAGSATLHDVRGPLEATVAAGSLSLHGPIQVGDSRISCDMGAASIHLEPGADVRLRVRTALGRASVDLPGSAESVPGGGQEWVVGGGRAALTVEANLGSVSVQGEDAPMADAG